MAASISARLASSCVASWSTGGTVPVASDWSIACSAVKDCASSGAASAAASSLGVPPPVPNEGAHSVAAADSPVTCSAAVPRASASIILPSLMAVGC